MRFVVVFILSLKISKVLFYIIDQCNSLGEIWSELGMCEMTCKGPYCPLEVDINQARCYCVKAGYVRDENGNCVPEENCRKF